MAALAAHIVAVSETLAAQLKTARRRIPQGQQEGAMLNMGLESGLASALQDCCVNHATRVTRLIRDVVRNGLAVISNVGGECCLSFSMTFPDHSVSVGTCCFCFFLLQN